VERVNIFNGKARSKRFTLTLIGFIGCLVAATLKHFLPGLSVELVITGAGLIGTYNAAESWRPSPPTGGQG